MFYGFRAMLKVFQSASTCVQEVLRSVPSASSPMRAPRGGGASFDAAGFRARRARVHARAAERGGGGGGRPARAPGRCSSLRTPQRERSMQGGGEQCVADTFSARPRAYRLCSNSCKSYRMHFLCFFLPPSGAKGSPELQGPGGRGRRGGSRGQHELEQRLPAVPADVQPVRARDSSRDPVHSRLAILVISRFGCSRCHPFQPRVGESIQPGSSCFVLSPVHASGRIGIAGATP